MKYKCIRCGYRADIRHDMCPVCLGVGKFMEEKA